MLVQTKERLWSLGMVVIISVALFLVARFGRPLVVVNSPLVAEGAVSVTAGDVDVLVD